MGGGERGLTAQVFDVCFYQRLWLNRFCGIRLITLSWACNRCWALVQPGVKSGARIRLGVDGEALFHVKNNPGGAPLGTRREKACTGALGEDSTL